MKKFLMLCLVVSSFVASPALAEDQTPENGGASTDGATNADGVATNAENGAPASDGAGAASEPQYSQPVETDAGGRPYLPGER